MNYRKHAQGQPCMVEGCDKPSATKSRECAMHRARRTRTGSYECARPIIADPQERLLNNCEPVTESGCWLWTGPLLSVGYGKFTMKNRTVSAHRAAYQLLVGPIPDGAHVLHRCDIRECVNPAHLYCGTPTQNMRDRELRDRAGRKLNIEQVQAIRADGRSTRAIARDYGISSGHVSAVQRGISWRRV